MMGEIGYAAALHTNASCVGGLALWTTAYLFCGTSLGVFSSYDQQGRDGMQKYPYAYLCL